MDVRLPNLETTITIGPVATTGPIATRQKRAQLLALQSLRKIRFQYISTNILLIGGRPTPWKIWVRQIGSSSQLLGKIKALFQTTNQLGMYEPYHEPFRNLYLALSFTWFTPQWKRTPCLLASGIQQTALECLDYAALLKEFNRG